MNLEWPGASQVQQRAFRRLFVRLSRPVPQGAEIVTAYTDGQVTLRSNRGKERYHEAADLSSYQGVEPGDFVVHGLDIMRGSVGVSDSRGAMSPVCIVCRPTKLAEPRYMAYAMRLQAASDYPKALARGVRDGGADFRRWDTLADLPLPAPPVAEQRAIADFLDRETAKIDALIKKQNELIALLQERRRVLAYRNVLGQPATRVAADSWFGVPPTHWSIDKLGRHASISNGSTPSREHTAYWADGHFPWLNSSNANQDIVTEGKEFVTTDALRECHLPILHPGAVLVGITGQGRTRGMATLLGIKATINQHLAAVVPDRHYWDSRYLMMLIGTAYDELRRLSDEGGSTKGALTCADLNSFRVPRPPLPEQRTIVAHLGAETAKIDELIAKAEEHVDFAKERRATLITAAVTGQIDVTGRAS